MRNPYITYTRSYFDSFQKGIKRKPYSNYRYNQHEIGKNANLLDLAQETLLIWCLLHPDTVLAVLASGSFVAAQLEGGDGREMSGVPPHTIHVWNWHFKYKLLLNIQFIMQMNFRAPQTIYCFRLWSRPFRAHMTALIGADVTSPALNDK